MADDDDRLSEWLEDAPTFLEESGAIPLALPEDDVTTPHRTLCMRCLKPAKTGGDAARPTFEEMEANAVGTCWRSMATESGAGWWWCSARRPFVLVLTG